MTNFERIKILTVDDVAEYLYKTNDLLMDEICINSYNNDCPFGDTVQPSDCKNCVKVWLNREINP